MSRLSRPWIELLFLHVVIATGIAWFSMMFRPSHVTFKYLSPVSVGQLIVLAIWLPLAHGRPILRLPIYFGLGTIVNVIGLNLPQWRTIEMHYVLIPSITSTLIMLIIVSLPLTFFRLQGWRLQVVDYPGPSTPWQISTATIFAFTLLIALMLALHRLVTSMGLRSEDGTITYPNNAYTALATIVVLGVAILGFGIAVLSAVWGCLGAQGTRSRLLSTVLVVVVIMAVPMHVSGGRAHVDWALMFGISMLTVVMSLVYLRYRHVRIVNASANDRAVAQRVSSSIV